MKHSHDTTLYTRGKGILLFDRLDDAGLPTGLRDLGNVTEFTLGPEPETVEHYSSREGINKMDLEAISQVKLKGTFTLEEFDRDNLAMALFGEADAFSVRHLSVSEIQGALDFVGTNDIGMKVHVQLWNVKLKPTGKVPFITNDWAAIPFEFTVQDDQADNPDSPYGMTTPLEES